MSRPVFALIVFAVIALAFLAMWLGWRARLRRDASVHRSGPAPVGELIAEFNRVTYVSTTPVGQPLTRVAIPGLWYKGFADVAIRLDGITIQVTGEDPVHIAKAAVLGSGTASRRVGKAVEHDGLALLRWSTEQQQLESSFRFDAKAEQRRFTDALERLTHSAAGTTAETTTTSQEDAQ